MSCSAQRPERRLEPRKCRQPCIIYFIHYSSSVVRTRRKFDTSTCNILKCRTYTTTHRGIRQLSGYLVHQNMFLPNSVYHPNTWITGFMSPLLLIIVFRRIDSWAVGLCILCLLHNIRIERSLANISWSQEEVLTIT